MAMSRHRTFSRHARIAGDCSICLYPLQGRHITVRPCDHMVCTPCYHEGVRIGLTDSSFNPDACEQCRSTPCTKTRHGSSLITSFLSSKQLVASTAVATKPQGPTPRQGPSAGIPGDAGADTRAGRPKSKTAKEKDKKTKKRKEREEKEGVETGGFATEARGQVRAEGIAVPVGNRRTCLQDATWALLMARFPKTNISLDTIRTAITTDSCASGADPSFSMANAHVHDYGLELKYDRELNNPRAMFKRRSGLYLVQLVIQTESGSDQHYVAYLAASGHVIDNEPRARVPIVEDSDRCSNKAAIKVFQQLFPRATGIRMGAVSELRTVSEQHQQATPTSSTNKRISTDSCASGVSYWSSKPTLEDLFFELYDQKVINYGELIDCIK